MMGTRRTATWVSVVWAAVIGSVVLGGCAAWPKPTTSEHVGVAGQVGACADFFSRLDHWTVAEEAVDSGEARVESYPYLRVNRFLASFAKDTENASAFQAWAGRMQQLDQQARQSEIANLSDEVVAHLDDAGSREALRRSVAHCGDLLKAHDFSPASDREHLRNRAAVPDEYLTARRFVGLYPITRLFVSRGVHKWHREERTSYSTLPPVNWQSIHKFECSTAPATMRSVPCACRYAVLMNKLRLTYAIEFFCWYGRDSGSRTRLSVELELVHLALVPNLTI